MRPPVGKPGRPGIGHSRPPRPPQWKPPHRRPIYHGWNPSTWQRDFLLKTIFIRFGKSILWDPSSWRYPVPSNVSGLVYRAERTSYDLRESFESQVSQYDLVEYQGCNTALNRVRNLDNALGDLRARTGSVDSGTMRELTRTVVECAQLVQRSFNRHSYLNDLVPGEWENLRGDVASLGAFYRVPTPGL